MIQQLEDRVDITTNGTAMATADEQAYDSGGADQGGYGQEYDNIREYSGNISNFLERFNRTTSYPTAAPTLNYTVAPHFDTNCPCQLNP